MSVALYIVAEREVPGLNTFVNGKALGHCDHLDQLAGDASVRPLMEFFSQDPKEGARFIEQEGGEVPEGGLPAEQWFAAEEGLVTIRSLLARLVANPGAIPRAPAVTAELRQFEAVLSALAAAGVRWHLAVDF